MRKTDYKAVNTYEKLFNATELESIKTGNVNCHLRNEQRFYLQMLTFNVAKVQVSGPCMNWYNRSGKELTKVLEMFTLSDPVIPLLGIYAKEMWKMQPRLCEKGFAVS